MSALLDSAHVPVQPRPTLEADGLSAAHGAALRAFRSLLFSLDPSKYFGGLQRVYNPAGDLLWICPDHYTYYDRGLPSLG